MSDVRILDAEVREQTGKGVARRLRMKGRVPAILYGRGIQSVALAVEPRALYRSLDPKRGFNTLLTLRVRTNGSTQDRTVLIKDRQIHPLSRDLVHVDFIEVQKDQKVNVRVPLVLNGRPKGVELGGVLHQVFRFLDVRCLPDAIPDKIEADVSHLGLGHAIHVRDVKYPVGVEPAQDALATLATVSIEKEEAAKEEAVPAEGAVAAEGAAPAEGAAAAAAAAPGAPGTAPAAAPKAKEEPEKKKK